MIESGELYLEDDLHLVLVALALLVASESAAAMQGGRWEARVRPHPLSDPGGRQQPRHWVGGGRNGRGLLCCVPEREKK